MTTTTRITISLGQRTGSPAFRATQDAVEECVASLVAGMEPDAEVTVTSRGDDGADVVEVDGDRQHPTAREIKDRLGEADWEAEQDAISEAQHDAEQAKAQRPEVIAAAQAKHDEQMLQAGGMAPVDCLEDLLALVPSLSEQALTSLPTFGGEAPASTHGVFSWDEKRLLVQDRTGWRIVARSERQ